MQALVDELERMMHSASRLPVGGKLLIDETGLRRLIEEMRASLPDEQRQEQWMAAERERLLADARAQARRIIEDAHAQGGIRIDDQAVVVAARQRARDVTIEAEKTAAQLKADADHYIMNQFNMMEARLTRVLREVQAGQRALSKGQEGGDRTPAQGGQPGGSPGQANTR